MCGMNNNKVTPKDRRDIINQAESGKLQKDIAVDFGISEAYVSKIVKGSKPQTRPPVKSLESISIDNLYNQLTELSRKMAEMFSEKSSRWSAARSLKRQLSNDNKTLLETADKELKQITQASMTATQRMIVWNEDHTTLDAGLINLYAEQLAIFREYARRGQSLPNVSKW